MELVKDNEYEKSFALLYNKAEKVSSAVFLVSDLLPDGEQLKTHIRQHSVELVAACAALKGGSRAEKVSLAEKAESLSRLLSSMFHITSIAGLLSPMNVEILRGEFDLLIKLVNEHTAVIYGSIGLYLQERSETVKAPVEHLRQAERIISVAPIRQENGNGSKGLKTNRKDTREKMILDFLKSKDSVNIKDIAKNVKGCSEKTIQRELIKLMEQGAVQRTGERRWSRYSYIV